jgi:hypothetical protein
MIAENGIRNLWSLPIINLAECGATNPIKPITPAVAVYAKVVQS